MALMALLGTDLLLHILPFSYLHRGVRRFSVGSPPLEKLRTLRRVCRAVEWAVSAYFKPVQCLQRSAVSTCLLRIGGIPAELVFGVRTFPFEAHAWTEFEGQIIGDSPANVRRYLVLDRI